MKIGPLSVEYKVGDAKRGQRQVGTGLTLHWWRPEQGIFRVEVEWLGRLVSWSKGARLRVDYAENVSKAWAQKPVGNA